MLPKTKIAIAGIGGVGGYFGGLLARRFQNDPDVQIIFLARGEHLARIREEGLRVIHDANSFVAVPALATDDADLIGPVDYLILCTKSYDLNSIMQQLRPCIYEKTVILPLLNGVDHASQIQKLVPRARVVQGCAYIISRILEPGVVGNIGNIQKIFFGEDRPVNKDSALQHLQDLFLSAAIDSKLVDNISTVLWEKYLFISPLASATSYYDCSIGDLVADDQKLQIITDLTSELLLLAKVKGIPLADDFAQRNIQKMKLLPPETTSSMHSDFKSGKPQTELQTLSGYVVEQAGIYNLPVPSYQKVYSQLAAKNIH